MTGKVSMVIYNNSFRYLLSVSHMPDTGPSALYVSLQQSSQQSMTKKLLLPCLTVKKWESMRLSRVEEFCTNVITWDLKPAFYNFIAMFRTTVSYCLETCIHLLNTSNHLCVRYWDRDSSCCTWKGQSLIKNMH